MAQPDIAICFPPKQGFDTKADINARCPQAGSPYAISLFRSYDKAASPVIVNGRRNMPRGEPPGALLVAKIDQVAGKEAVANSAMQPEFVIQLHCAAGGTG